MQSRHGISSVLGDNEGLGELLVPFVHVIGQSVLDRLEVARILVPAEVAVDALNVCVLSL